MKILVINGPNLNMLGIREPEMYGRETYEDLLEKIRRHAEKTGTEVSFYQSNHEGDLVDAIQGAYGIQDGIVLNPGAYTHTSVALLDALKAVGIRTWKCTSQMWMSARSSAGSATCAQPARKRFPATGRTDTWKPWIF